MNNDILNESFRVVQLNNGDGTITASDIGARWKCYDESVKEGDFVLVADGCRDGFRVVKVHMIYDYKDGDCIPTNSIVCKCDYQTFLDRQKRIEKATELKRKMDQRVKELQGIAMYKLMAESDSQLAEMLKEFQEVTGK